MNTEQRYETLAPGAMLDCGHVESPHSDITRGYGRDKDGKQVSRATWWLLMETSDRAVAIGKQYRLMVTTEQ